MIRVRAGVWLVVSVLVLAGGVAIRRISAQATGIRALYDDDVRFQQLSTAGQTLLELKFGRKGTSLAELPDEVVLGAEASETVVGQPFTNVLVNAVPDPASNDTQSETTLVLGSGSVVVVGYNDSGSCSPIASCGITVNQFTGWARSTNGGASFTDMGALPASTDGDAGDPVLARDTVSGAIYFSALNFNTFTGIQVFKSVDNGASFGAPVNGAPGTGGPGDDKEWMTVDNFAGPGQGNVYLTWREFSPALAPGIKFTRSTDAGATFGPAGGVLLAPGTPFNVQGPFVVVGADHSVYVFYYDSSPAPDEIRVRRSTDFGVTFAPAVTVTTLNSTGVNGSLALSGGFRSNSFPHAAVNPVSGNLYVVYNNCSSSPCTTAADRGNIFFRQSTDSGATWSAPALVNDDGTTTQQFFPTPAVLPDGSKLLITFYDRRLAANTIIDRYGSVSSVSGATVLLGPNGRITSASFPVAIAQDPIIVSTYMGDYDQAVASASAFHVTWGDNRLGNAFHVNQPDVRFATIPVITACGGHRVHGHISTSPPSHSGNVSHEHHGQHGHRVAANCPPHAPGHSPGLFLDPDEVLFGVGTQTGEAIFSPNQKTVKRGSIVSLYGPADGLFIGPRDDQPAPGFLAPASGMPLYYTSRLPQVSIAGAPAPVMFSGLAPGRQGIWQINVVVPAQAAPGRHPVRISYAGADWNAAQLIVQ